MGTDDVEIQSADIPPSSLPANESEEGKRKRIDNRPYPKKALSEALKVITAIKEQNAGKPWNAASIADAIGRKPRSSDFQYIISAAREYGLIEGNFRSDQVSFTELGRSIAYPNNEKEEKANQFKSFMNINLFKLVYEHYEGSPLPEKRFFTNTLIDKFKINPIHVDEFISLFEGNCRFLGINPANSVKFTLNDDLFEAPDPHDNVNTRITINKSVVKSGRNTAFVIMPFVERNQNRSEGFFKEVYNALIKPAAQSAGFDVDWANQAGSDVIQSTIINKIMDSDLLIVDLTDHNPNVLFELGLRVADNNGPMALIKSSDTGRLFDVDNMMRVYEYNHSLWSSTLQIDLPNLEAHIRAAWDNREINPTYMDILRKKPA